MASMAALPRANVQFDLSNRVCLVTGAGLGIGRAVARVFAASQCDLMLCDVNATALDETAAAIRAEQPERRVLTSAVDVRHYAGLEAAAQVAVRDLGRLDFCIANAGIGRGGNVLSLEEETWDDVIDINMKGVFFTVKACAREMVAQNRGGRILTISSANAVIAGAGAAAYCGTKAAVAMMTRCWAQDLVPFGITVNCIGPGATDTGLMLSQVDHPDAMKGLMNAIPVGRMATPEEIAYSCAFYCSDGGAYLNGTFLLQDGGLRDHSSDRAPVLEKIAADRATLSGPELLAKIDAEHSAEVEKSRAQREKFALQ